MSRLNVNDVRCEALFASGLQRSDEPTAPEVVDAITRAIRTLGSHGCATRMAQEFGDNPQGAVSRMRWARDKVAEIFGTPSPRELARVGSVAVAERAA
jgi:hypothetical protein